MAEEEQQAAPSSSKGEQEAPEKQAAAQDAEEGAKKSEYECPFCVMMRKGGCEVPFKVRLVEALSRAAPRRVLRAAAAALPRCTGDACAVQPQQNPASRTHGTTVQSSALCPNRWDNHGLGSADAATAAPPPAASRPAFSHHATLRSSPRPNQPSLFCRRSWSAASRPTRPRRT